MNQSLELLNTDFAEIFQVLPIERSMPELVVTARAPEPVQEIVAEMGATIGDPMLMAGLWVYVDNLSKAHELVQEDSSPVGCYWHGIIHRREGDFENSLYWFRRAAALNLRLQVPPSNLVDLVERNRIEDQKAALEAQRAEWLALMAFCVHARVERS